MKTNLKTQTNELIVLSNYLTGTWKITDMSCWSMSRKRKEKCFNHKMLVIKLRELLSEESVETWLMKI